MGARRVDEVAARRRARIAPARRRLRRGAAAAALVALTLSACGSQVELAGGAGAGVPGGPVAPSTTTAAPVTTAVTLVQRGRGVHLHGPHRPGPPRILVVGDSVVQLSSAALRQRLARDGWVPTVIGLNGWRLDQIDVLYRNEDVGRDWDAVVVWAGNNDLLQHDPWRADLDRTVARLSAERCGVLVGVSDVWWAQHLGIDRPNTAVVYSQAAAFDAEAARLARVDGLSFVPWQREVRSPQPWFRWDLIHVTPLGAVHAADLIAAAAHGCLPPQRG